MEVWESKTDDCRWPLRLSYAACVRQLGSISDSVAVVWTIVEIYRQTRTTQSHNGYLYALGESQNAPERNYRRLTKRVPLRGLLPFEFEAWMKRSPKCTRPTESFVEQFDLKFGRSLRCFYTCYLDCGIHGTERGVAYVLYPEWAFNKMTGCSLDHW